MKPPMTVALLLAAALLGACATPSLSQLQAQSAALRTQRSAIADSNEPLSTLLTRPLDADGAVRVALLGNPGVRATAAQLQFAQGDLQDALRPLGPSFDIARLDAAGVTRITWSVSQPLLDLLFVRYRRQHGELAMRQAQQLVADQLLQLERDVRQAWLAHAAAGLRVRVAERAAAAATLGAELAQRYHDAGNVSELQWRAEQALAGEAQLRLAARQAEQLRARSALLDLLGQRDTQPGLSFDERLSVPAPFSGDAAVLATQAVENRLDLAAQRAAVDLAQRERQHLRRWRWLPGLDVSYARERETGQATLDGPGATLQVPLLNAGGSRVARASALQAQRQAQLEGKVLAVQNRIAQDSALLTAAHSSFDVHARQLLQVNQRILELAGQQHNFMLIGSFELLAARRRQIEGSDLWIDAVENWWRVFNDLSYESGSVLPLAPVTAYISAEDLP